MILFIDISGNLIESDCKTHKEYLERNNLKLEDLVNNGYIQCNNTSETYIRFNRFIRPNDMQIKGIKLYLNDIRKKFDKFHVLIYPYSFGKEYPTNITVEELLKDYL